MPRQLSTLPVAATLSKNTTLLPTPSYSLGLLFVYYIVLRIVRACVRAKPGRQISGAGLKSSCDALDEDDGNQAV